MAPYTLTLTSHGTPEPAKRVSEAVPFFDPAQFLRFGDYFDRDTFLAPWMAGWKLGPWAATGTPTDRRGGRDLPRIRSEQDLRLFRVLSRYLCDENEFAKGFMGLLEDFNIRAGFGWQACLKGAAKGSYASGVTPTDPAVRRAQYTLDRFRDGEPGNLLSAWPIRSREGFRRWRRDGEKFTRLFRGGRGELPKLRFVDPSQVGHPTGTVDGVGSFGRLADPDDHEAALAYFVRRHDGVEPGDGCWVTVDRRVDAGEVEDALSRAGWGGDEVRPGTLIHLTANVDCDVARGVPDFFPVAERLEGIRDLLTNMLDVAGTLSKIAWLEKYATATYEQARTAAEAGKTYDRENMLALLGGATNRTAVTHLPAGARMHVDGGRDVLPGPTQTGASAFIEVEQACLRGAGTLWRFPEYFSGDASNNNYASIKESGSPFRAAIEGSQLVWGAYERHVALKVLELAAAAGYDTPDGPLTPDDLKRVDVDVTPPKVVMSDPQADATVSDMKLRNGTMSKAEAILADGRDPQRTFDQIAAEAKSAVATPGVQPGEGGFGEGDPGAGGGDDDGGPGGGPGGGPVPTREGKEDDEDDPHSLLLLALLGLAEEGADPETLHHLAELSDDPAALEELLGSAVAESRGWVSEAWSADLHPRDKSGRFIKKAEIEQAKTDPAKAAELRAKVKPADAGKLEAAIDGSADLRNKRETAKADAQKRRADRGAAHARAKELTALVHGGQHEPHHWSELAELLPHLTSEQLTNLRTAAHHYGAKFGAGKSPRRQQKVDALAAFARGQAQAKKEPREGEKTGAGPVDHAGAANAALAADGANPGGLSVLSVGPDGVMVRHATGEEQQYTWAALDRKVDGRLGKRAVVASLSAVRDATRDARPGPMAPPPPPGGPSDDPEPEHLGTHGASGLSFALSGDTVHVTGRTGAHAAALRRAGFKFVEPEDVDADAPLAPGYKRPEGHWEGTLDQAVNLDVPRSWDLPGVLGVRTKSRVGGRKVVTGTTRSTPPAPDPAESRPADANTPDVGTTRAAPTGREFAAEVQAAADAETRGFGEGKVFIHHVYDALAAKYPGLTREEFNARLLDANRQGHVQLARADLVQLMHPDDVRASVVSDGWSDVHLIHAAPKQRAERSAGQEWPGSAPAPSSPPGSPPAPAPAPADTSPEAVGASILAHAAKGHPDDVHSLHDVRAAHPHLSDAEFKAGYQHLIDTGKVRVYGDKAAAALSDEQKAYTPVHVDTVGGIDRAHDTFSVRQAEPAPAPSGDDALEAAVRGVNDAARSAGTIPSRSQANRVQAALTKLPPARLKALARRLGVKAGGLTHPQLAAALLKDVGTMHDMLSSGGEGTVAAIPDSPAAEAHVAAAERHAGAAKTPGGEKTGGRDPKGGAGGKAPALTPAESRAVASYKNAGHVGINRSLRSGEMDPRDEPLVASLDSAAAKSPLPGPVTVYRGFGNRDLLSDSGFPADPKPGDVFTDRGFVSTSTDKGLVARKWATKPNDVHAEIRVPAGVGGIHTDRHVTGQEAEGEILLQRGLSFRVVSREPHPSGKGYKLTLEVVRPASP